MQIWSSCVDDKYYSKVYEQEDSFFTAEDKKKWVKIKEGSPLKQECPAMQDILLIDISILALLFIDCDAPVRSVGWRVVVPIIKGM